MRKLRAIKILTDFAESELYLCSSSAAEPYRRAIAELEQLQAEIKRYKQALITIEARTIDIEPPYRAISANMMRDIAIKALKGE